MDKRITLISLIISFIFTGCSKNYPTDMAEKNGQSTSSTIMSSVKTDDAIDYR